MTFQLEGQVGSARAGRLTTRRGTLATPLFMPVGTHATVRGASSEDLWECGARMLLANTYHLLIRPGPEVFEHFGGIHRFMNWGGGVLTDSGGFQIFSMPTDRALDENGATFRSYVDGRLIQLTPELSIKTQLSIGSDIMMVLDECVPSTSEREIAARAMERTHRWALRSLHARGESSAGVFAIVQGALFPDLRAASCDFLTQHPFDGYAIGGLAVGETKSEREEFTGLTTALLPKDRPRYLMGVGKPIDLLEAVDRGVDMFDCILPTAMAQHGRAYTFNGSVYVRRSAYARADEPIEEGCPCLACRRYSRGYIHHLIKANEGQGWHLLALHNLRFYQRLTAAMRAHILAGSWQSFANESRQRLANSDGEDKGLTACKTVAKRAKKPRELGAFCLRVAEDGSGRIADRQSGEVMHPGSAPDLEAVGLYVKQSMLVSLANGAAEDQPLFIWDVGLGAGHNAMAAIHALEAAARGRGVSLRRVRLISFETDLDALRLALAHVERFAHLKHGAPRRLVADGVWRSSHLDLEWTLVHGDVLASMHNSPKPRLVFWDPFSLRADPYLWTLSTFRAMSEFVGDGACELWTYSTSTAVRTAMMAGGFHVARTDGVGARGEATVAYSEVAWRERIGRGSEPLPYTPLDRRWLERWERSSARWPHGLPPADEPSVASLVLAHPQFAMTSSPDS